MYLKKPLSVTAIRQKHDAPPVAEHVLLTGVFAYGGKDGTTLTFAPESGVENDALRLSGLARIEFPDGRTLSQSELVETLTTTKAFLSPEHDRRRTAPPKRQWVGWMLSGLFVVLMALGTAAFSQTAGDGPTGTITTELTDQQDADIAERIREILRELGGYSDVTVSSSEGIVTLRGTAASEADGEALTSLVARVEGVVAIKNEVAATTDISERLSPAMERFTNRTTQLLTFLPILLIAAVVFAFVVFIGYLLSSWRKPWERLAPNLFIANLYSQLVQLAFVIGGLVIALDILDATALLSTILGAAGIVGLAFGFAVRDTVENYIASILLSIRQPFRPNDAVEINGDEGKVIRLTSRATILLSFDGNHIRIPNSTVFKSRIVNYSQNAERRFMFTIGVDPAADIEAARALATETVQSLPFVVGEPAALTWIDRITESGVELTVTGWVDQDETSIVRAKGEALRQVKLAIEAAGIELPDTTYRIRLDGAGTGSVTLDDSGRAARQPPPPPRPVTPTASEVAAVDTSEEAALDKLIDAERTDEASEDLLSEEAEKE